MKRILLLILLTLISTQSSGEDFDRLYKDLNIIWTVTPEDLLSNWESNIYVCWLGKNRGYKVFKDKKGRTNIFWHFTFHDFINPGPAAINEPFIVRDEGSGTFIFHLVIISMSAKEADEFVNSHKEPYYILIVGQPKYILKYKGAPTVVVESDRWVVSDYFKVHFIKAIRKRT